MDAVSLVQLLRRRSWREVRGAQRAGDMEPPRGHFPALNAQEKAQVGAGREGPRGRGFGWRKKGREGLLKRGALAWQLGR